MLYLKALFKIQIKEVYVDFPICGEGGVFVILEKNSPTLFSFWKILKPPKTPTKLLMCYGAVRLKNNSLTSSIIQTFQKLAKSRRPF